MSDASGLASGDVRRHNLALVLGHVARVGPTSRSEIAESTKLTRGAVTALVQVLIEADWLQAAESVGGNKGRPRTRLELTAHSLALLAVEIAPGAVRVLVTSVAGVELLSLRGEYRGADPDSAITVSARLVNEAVSTMESAGRRVVDATVIVLAPVGGSPARVLADAVLGWRDVDVVGALRHLTPGLDGASVHLASDAPLAARAEFRRLDGIRNAIYLKGDSNIGGALMIDGATADGAHGFGGSLGHLPIVPNGSLCACGQHGCLLTVAGVPALLRAAHLEDELQSLTAAAALDAFLSQVRAGEPNAVDSWTAATAWIGRALQILAMAIDPQVIVIGGQWASLTDSIRAAFDGDRPAIASTPEFAVTVIAGAHGDLAGLRGALEAARDRVIRDPLATPTPRT